MTGFDIDAEKAACLNASGSYIPHIAPETLRPLLDAGRFRASADFGELAGMDAVLICVPTPLSLAGEPDLRFVEDSARTVARTLRPGQLVVLDSTTYPGTTTELVKPILESHGLKSGSDFFLAYAPEREDPGNPTFGTANIPKCPSGKKLFRWNRL